MPSWNEVLKELTPPTLDDLRRRYLADLFDYTGRNIIAYYSGWLQKPSSDKAQILDSDKNGFMNAIYQMDKAKGLDLILHTPGGDIAATESLVYYLREVFGNNIRVIVPQLAMSAGTMIACSAKSILMGKHSNLGPIDPHINGWPTHAVLYEFERAKQEIAKNPANIPMWQVIISKYHPTFLTACENAIKLSSQVVTDWLITGMFNGDPDAKAKADTVVENLNNHLDTKTHSRHIHINDAKNLGLVIEDLEDDDKLQDLVLTVHHAYMHTMANSPAIKIIENHDGKAIVENTAR